MRMMMVVVVLLLNRNACYLIEIVLIIHLALVDPFVWMEWDRRRAKGMTRMRRTTSISCVLYGASRRAS